VGKTTAIREVSRMLADEYNKRVVIVDTSNEIGGDGDIPHPGIGRARRMQVPSPEFQHHVSPRPLFAALQISDGFTCSTVLFERAWDLFARCTSNPGKFGQLCPEVVG
jgi:hypothetical protein